MQETDETKKQENNTVPDESRKKQQQSDPQMTELKGFFDKDEKLEPKLEDDKEEEQGK